MPSFHVSDENLSKTNVRAAVQDVVTKFMDVRSKDKKHRLDAY